MTRESDITIEDMAYAERLLEAARIERHDVSPDDEVAAVVLSALIEMLADSANGDITLTGLPVAIRDGLENEALITPPQSRLVGIDQVSEEHRQAIYRRYLDWIERKPPLPHSSPIDQRIEAFLQKHLITGTVMESESETDSRAFLVSLTYADRKAQFTVRVGRHHPAIDLVFALRWLLETALGTEESTYERWLAEGSSEYQEDLGDVEARAIYQSGHETDRRLQELFGEALYRALRDAILDR